jgi:WD40 repeat protein
VRIWDVETGLVEATLEGHTAWVKSVSFSPNGKHVVSGSDDCTVRIWDVETEEVKATLEGHTEEVRSVSFSPEGTRVVSGSNDRTVRIWDVESGQVEASHEAHTGSVSSVSFSPDGKHVVSGSDDCTVRIWDVEAEEVRATLEGHTSSVYSVLFSPDGRRVVCGSLDHTVRIWDVETRQVVGDQNELKEFGLIDGMVSNSKDCYNTMQNKNALVIVRPVMSSIKCFRGMPVRTQPCTVVVQLKLSLLELFDELDTIKFPTDLTKIVFGYHSIHWAFHFKLLTQATLIG